MTAAPDPGATPVTHGEWYALRHRYLRTIQILIVLVIGGFALGAFLLQRQAIDAKRYAYDQCQSRVVAVGKINTFNQAMATLESTNTVIGPALRNARIKLYRDQILSIPQCGRRP